MCFKCARSERGVAVYINKHDFFSILYIKRVNVQQVIDNLMHGETKTLIADESIIILDVGLGFVQ